MISKRQILVVVSYVANGFFIGSLILFLAHRHNMLAHGISNGEIVQKGVYSTPEFTIISENDEFVCYIGRARPIMVVKSGSELISIGVADQEYGILQSCDKNGCVTNIVCRDQKRPRISSFALLNQESK